MTKLRAYDSKALGAGYVTATQIMQNITELMVAAEADDVSKLPPSVFSTEQLYDLAICYAVMYETLSDHLLLANGHARQSKTIH